MGPISLWPAKPIWFGWRNIREELSGLWRSSRWTVQQLFWTGPRCWVCWENWHHYNGTGYSIFHWAADARRDGDRWALPPGYVGSGIEDVSWGGYPTYSTAGNGSLYASPCGSLQLLFSSILWQIPKVSPAVGVWVALTFGVHPRVVGNQVDWEQLNTLVKSPNCVGVGECGLDYTRPYL